MKELTVINKNGVLLTDSREVADMVGKRHDNLLRDIQGYIKVIEDSSKLRTANFFIESTYKNNNNQSYPCYLLTKQGCEMVANKMTGEKGILFTAEYVKRFNIMEECIKEAVKENEYTLEDKIAKLLSVLPEAERGKYMLELVDKFYFDNNTIGKANKNIHKDKGLTIDKVKDILRQAYDEAYVTTKGGYVIMLKKVVHKYLVPNGIRKHDFNKFIKDNNIAKINKDGYAWNQFRVDGKKNTWEYFIKAELFE